VALLVGFPEDTELAWALVAEQVEEVERALLRAVGSVLDRVGDVEEPAEPRPDSARNELLDPSTIDI
jgi:hypothetical protein